MDSPSAQLVGQSVFEVDGPPSSPFVTEVDAQIRVSSREWKRSVVEETHHHTQEIIMEYEDKENTPQNDSTLANFFDLPKKKPSTPETTASPLKERLNSSGNDADLMPPPSARKVSSPRKTPSKLSSSGTRTPKSLRRGNSSERTQQTTSTFQAGLDVRNAAVPAEDTRDGDETCYSAFSEIPDMTLFAKLGQSPTWRCNMTPGGQADATPRTSRKRSSPSRSPSPTPRRQKTPSLNHKDETTSFLIDFTQQFDGVPAGRTSPTKSATESNLLQYINNQRSPNKASPSKHYPATPAKGSNSNILTLLDFELPPAPTPRSIPTITVRELESLKSTHLSQLSSLKATLSGREAEVDSLKKAVADAERRAGESQEAVREERHKREVLSEEVESWKKRGVEFEGVLKSVREEVMRSEGEKDDLRRRLEEAQRAVEEAEARAGRAEERFEDALSARAEGGSGESEEQVQRLVAAQIDAKIEAVSRELHAVYKEKHERKVATLKKSYEARNEKKTAELQARVIDLEKTNEDLQTARDATFSGALLACTSSEDMIQLKSELEEHRAALARLETEISASQAQQEDLMRELRQERIEKGDLVAAVDEMLALQAEAPPTPSGKRALSVVEDFRKSISRPSPVSRIGGGVESKIGRSIPTPGLARAGSGGGVGKSRMLANIERMGRTGSGSGQSGE